MKNKTLRILSLALAGTSMVSTSLPVLAYEVDESGNSIEKTEYQNTEDEDYTNSTNVFAEIGSEYKVTIPKIIVLNGASKAAQYFVKVQGDIAGYETVTVEPDKSFTLTAKNKNAETASINQDKTSWKVDNFDTDAIGSVSAPNLTAGKWTGAFNFNINLEGELPVSVTAGLYDENDNLIKSWDKLEALGLLVEKDYTEEDYLTNDASGYSVFKNNNLSGKLVIPEGITKLGNNVFRNCDTLTAVTLPRSVEEIGLAAFADSDSLKSIDMSKLQMTSLGVFDDAGVETAGIFENCTALSSVKLPKKLERIGLGLFWNCTSLTSIGAAGSGASIEMPNTLKEIFTASFGLCTGLKTVDLSETSLETLTGIYGRMQGTTFLSYFGAFGNCTSLSNVKLPGTLKIFGDMSFNGCTSLSTIVIPKSVERIGYGALADTALTSITIPASVTEICPNLFNSKTGITELIFENPDNWVYLDDYNSTTSVPLDSLNNPSNNVTIYKSHVKDVFKRQ